jgi:hypothetical protein
VHVREERHPLVLSRVRPAAGLAGSYGLWALAQDLPQSPLSALRLKKVWRALSKDQVGLLKR